MIFPIIIGRDSTAKIHQIDLLETPILFVSYYSKKQLASICRQLSNYNHNFIATTTVQIKNWGLNLESNYVFLRDDPEKGSIQSRLNFLKLVSKTIRKRKRILRHFKAKNFREYISFHDKRKEKFEYQFLLIDDIWDIVISKQKQLALNLILLILEGPSVGIHSIIGSSLSYRNLLEQLISSYPKLTEELQKKFGNPPPRSIDQISEELIFTADDLIYFKKAKSMALEKFYKI